MNRRSFFLLPALVCALPARAQLKTPPAGMAVQWYAVKSDDDAFVVQMPGVPDHRILSDRSARGSAFATHSYSLEFAGNSYVAQTSLYPRDVDTTQPRRILQASLDARAQSLAGRKWAGTQWREIDGAAAVEATGVLGTGGQLRQLSLLKEQRFVSLAFLGPAVTTPDADRFFRSLKLK